MARGSVGKRSAALPSSCQWPSSFAPHRYSTDEMIRRNGPEVFQTTVRDYPRSEDIHYSLLAIPCSTSAFVSEPDGRNEKHSTMSAGFCWKWLSTERRTVSASAANGFLS